MAMDAMRRIDSQVAGELYYDNTYMQPTNRIQQYAKGNWTHLHRQWAEELVYAYGALELLGTVGALLIIITMIIGNRFIITYRVYLSLAAVIDIILLYILGGNLVLETLTGYNTVYDVILKSDITCRVYHVCVGFITQFNVWLNVALMIELFVIAVFPKKLNSESSMERAHFLSLLMLTVLLILNMNYFWTIKQQKEPQGLDRNELCYFDARFELFETKVYPVIDVAVLGVIPTVVWLGLLVFTAKKFYVQGETRPGGLLISTKEYWSISYSISTIYLVAHTPRVVWIIKQIAFFMYESEKNPGITTLQDFHTKLIDGDPLYNFPVVVAMALRLPVLILVSGEFRKELKKLFMLICCCCRNGNQYTLAKALNPTYKLSSTTLIPNSGSELSVSKKMANEGGERLT